MSLPILYVLSSSLSPVINLKVFRNHSTSSPLDLNVLHKDYYRRDDALRITGTSIKRHRADKKPIQRHIVHIRIYRNALYNLLDLNTIKRRYRFSTVNPET